MILNSGKQTLTSRDLSLLRNDGELPKDLLMAVVKSETAQAKRDKLMISWQGDSLRKLISQKHASCPQFVIISRTQFKIILCCIMKVDPNSSFWLFPLPICRIMYWYRWKKLHLNPLKGLERMLIQSSLHSKTKWWHGC